MATRALLHIGVAKSGTTSIQRFLNASRGHLRDLGFAYPEFLGLENHFDFAAYASAPFAEKTGRARGVEEWGQWRERFTDRFRQANEQTRDTWIVSSEHMSSWLTTDGQVADLCQMFAAVGIDRIDVLLYVRRQDFMAAASHAQWVKDGQSRQFDVESHIRMSVRYDFAALIDRWRGGPLVNRVTVCLFPDFAHMPTLINGFCDAIGIPAYALNEPRMNRSLSARCVERLRRVNAASGRWRPEVVDALRHRVVCDRGTDRYALSPADAQRIMSAYRDSNTRTLAQVSARRRVDDYFT